MDLKNKVAVVTGGASGIGEASCFAFSEAGASVVVADLDADLGKKVAQSISNRGGKAAFIKLDVSEEKACIDMVAFAKDTFGGLDCAVNSAGVGNPPRSMEEIDEAMWRRILDVNLMGVIFSMKHQIRAMRERGGGSIVNISSAAGLFGAQGMGPYVASKHAVVGLTKSTAIETGQHNIRVNAICPGLIKTPINEKFAPEGGWQPECPLKRVGQAQEVADTALWLASDRSSFVTGEAIRVDGGKYAGAPVPTPALARQ